MRKEPVVTKTIRFVGLDVHAATIAVAVAVTVVAWRGQSATDIPNRIPEAPPYLTSEAQAFPPPY